VLQSGLSTHIASSWVYCTKFRAERETSNVPQSGLSTHMAFSSAKFCIFRTEIENSNM
jgi:hypothetical protein